MPEHEPRRPGPGIERTPKMMSAISNVLYAHQFHEVLTPEKQKDVLALIIKIASLKSDLGEAQFIIQFFFDDTIEDLVNPKKMSWVGILYDTRTHGNTVRVLTSTGIHPTANEDLLDMPEYADIPQIILGWEDIRDDFDPPVPQ
jgi:hypothetical protein